jgi:hypothetical protein
VFDGEVSRAWCASQQRVAAGPLQGGALLTGELDADAAGSFREERLEDLRVGTCIFDGAQVCLLLAAQVEVRTSTGMAASSLDRAGSLACAKVGRAHPTSVRTISSLEDTGWL